MEYDNGYGRVFTEIGTENYTNKQGRTVLLRVWEAPCAHPGCSERFTIKTPVTDTANTSKAFFMKHCVAHRLTPQEAFRAMGVKRQLITDEQVAEIRAYALAGHKARDLALLYPVTERTIKAIISGERR